MLFVLLLFIRISLIFSKIYSGSHAYLECMCDCDTSEKRESAKAHSNWQTKTTKPHEKWDSCARHFVPWVFADVYVWLLFRFLYISLSLSSNATNILPILQCNMLNQNLWEHEATYKQNHFTASLIESMILTNNFICSHWQYFLIYTSTSHSHFPSRLVHSLSTTLIPTRMMKTN